MVCEDKDETLELSITEMQYNEGLCDQLIRRTP